MTLMFAFSGAGWVVKLYKHGEVRKGRTDVSSPPGGTEWKQQRYPEVKVEDK